MSDETPLHRLVVSDRKVQELEKDISATRLAISSLCDRGFPPPQSLLDSVSSLSRELDDEKWSSSELRGAIRPPPSQPGVSSHHQRFATATPVQPGPSHLEGDSASAGPSFSRRRSYDSPSGSFGRSSRQGSDPLPTRGVGSQTSRLTMRANRLQVADNGTMSRQTRRIFVLLLWLSYLTTS